MSKLLMRNIKVRLSDEKLEEILRATDNLKWVKPWIVDHQWYMGWCGEWAIFQYLNSGGWNVSKPDMTVWPEYNKLWKNDLLLECKGCSEKIGIHSKINRNGSNDPCWVFEKTDPGMSPNYKSEKCKCGKLAEIFVFVDRGKSRNEFVIRWIGPMDILYDLRSPFIWKWTETINPDKYRINEDSLINMGQ